MGDCACTLNALCPECATQVRIELTEILREQRENQPHSQQLAELLAEVAAVLDSAKAAGRIIPPVVAAGMANLGVVVMVLRGQEGTNTDAPTIADVREQLGGLIVPGRRA